MGGKSRDKSVSQPVLLPEQKRIWDFLTTQLIPQALGKETAATQIATQRARDEGAGMLNLQSDQIQQTANQGFGTAQRAQLLSQAQNSALQNTLKNILAQRQAAQQQGFQMLQGLPIQPGQQTISEKKGLSMGKQLGFAAAKGTLAAGFGAAGSPEGASAVGNTQLQA